MVFKTGEGAFVVTIPLIATLGQAIFKLLLGAVAIFLILLVLVQRGRGGGLAGALGGMGGSSAFGAKAGDVFTRVTIVAATIWIVLCIAAAKLTPSNASLININTAAPTSGSESLELPAISGIGEAEKTESEGNESEGGETGATTEEAPAENSEADANSQTTP